MNRYRTSTTILFDAGVSALIFGGVSLSAEEPHVSFTTVTVDATPPAKPYYKMLGDLDGDGRADIVLTPAELKGQRYKVAWYRAPGQATAGNWPEHVIVRDIECVIHSLGVADMDLDGDMDVAIAEMHQGADPDEVTVHLNGGDGRSWKRQVLSKRGSHDIVIGDIDADGDPDIVGANHSGDSAAVLLWRNETRSK